MKRKIRLFLISLLALISVSVCLLLIFSKYKFQKDLGRKAISYSIDIKVTVDSVFHFLGNSSNASKWSSFVNHITPLNPAQVPDGSVGSERRCFKEANETGIVWDERITEVVKNTKRQLVIFHLQGFSVQAEGLVTEQRYVPTKNGSRLTFCLFYQEGHPGWWDLFKTHYASFTIHTIFEKNLLNIKHILEGHPSLVTRL